MDQRDTEIADSDTTDTDDRSNNQNKRINLVDTEVQTCDEYSQSQDLFDDDESFAENSRFFNLFDAVLPETGKIINTTSDSPALNHDLTVLTQTPKIGNEEESGPYHATVPSIPKSLVPFISTVNESWNSDLETPQAKTAAELNLQSNERSAPLSKSCETMERKRCDMIRPSGVTTPNGYFIIEDERISTSPILNTMSKRRRPKRRILKSLIEATNPSDSFKEDKYNSTFVVDENCSVLNSNIRLEQDEIIAEAVESEEGLKDDRTVIINVQDSTLNENYGEKCLLNERLQWSEDLGETSRDVASKPEEDEEIIERSVRKDEAANKELSDDEYGEIEVQEKSVVELFEEIKELQKNEKQITQHNFEDIPMEIFNRDAEALENAQMVPMTKPPNKSTTQKQRGFVSFTEMCLLEQENSENEDAGVEETEKIDPTIENSEFPHKIQTYKFTSAESAAVSSKDDKHVGNIVSSSFNERDEPPIDIDEFSPWFYQPNDVKSEVLNKSNTEEDESTKENVKSTKIDWEIDEMKSIGFSTANGKRITISKDRIRRAQKLYNEITLQDEKYYDAKMLNDGIEDRLMNNKENEATIEKDSYSLMGFSTAGGKAIKISKDKLKAATKLYEEIALQDEKLHDAKMLDNRTEDWRMNNKENAAKILKDSHSLIGFSTAGGKAIKISKDKLKAATKLYQEIALEDEKHHDAKVLNTETGGRRITNKDNEGTTFGNSYSSMSFSTTSEKSIKISEGRLKEAAKLYDEINSTDSNIQLAGNSTEVSTARGIKRRREYDDDDFPGTCVVDSLIGFKTACGKSLNISETAMKKAKIMYQSIDSVDSQLSRNNNSTQELINPSNKETKQRNSENLIKDKLYQFNKPRDPVIGNFAPQERSIRKLVDQIISSNISSSNKSISTGFNTANGKSIEISNQALSNARNLFKEEENGLELTPPNPKDGCKKAVIGFSSASGKWVEISEDTTTESKKCIIADLENTPPPYMLLKRNSTAMESSPLEFSNVSASKTPALESLSKNTSLDILQSSKRVRLNCDLQARKLFNESDEETEFPEKFDQENNKNVIKPFHHGNSFGHRLLRHENNKNVSFNRNSTAGLYAKSEMFKTNDRLMLKLKARNSWPLNQDVEASRFAQDINKDNSRSGQMQKSRRASTYSQEIEASTEALLADEENSLDGKSWTSAITCSPTMIEDRDVSVKPITLDTNCDKIVQELPTSPIFGAKYRMRKKIRRNKRNLLKKDSGCNLNGDLEGQIVVQNSQQSSGVVTPNSDSSKESNKDINAVINTTLVSELKKLKETSAGVEFHDNSIGRTPGDIDDGEAIDYLLENRIAATLRQEKQIRTKKKCKPKPIPGNLLLRKTQNKKLRVSWRRATNGAAPTPRTCDELKSLGIRPDVMEVTAATALDYKFRCLDFYSKDEIRASNCGIEIGDGSRLIFDENGYAGVTEFEKAFMASPGVDPALVPLRWVENHYRWILWKLACMDRTKFGDLSMPRTLTPSNLMEQLKYRYDREIDKSERSALRRIIEKDDLPCSRMILCVATIAKIENIQALEKSPKMTPTSYWKVELTDGWYGITATIDSAMAHLIAFGKVREGTKLVTCRAELLNCEQGCSPLEVPCDVSLKIHTNSTRRSKWDTKLGYCRYAGPIPTSLTTVLPNGGLIGKLKTVIARVYPMQYFEKTPSGYSVFRNNKSEDKAVMMYEEERQKQIDTIYTKARAEFEAKNGKLCRDQWKDEDPDSYRQIDRQMSEETFQRRVESMLLEGLPPPRKVTLVLKVRVMDGDNLAILTVWAPGEDIVDVLKEGNRVSIHNVQTSGKRSGELQLTAGHQSFVKLEESNVPLFSRRCFTSIPEIGVAGFNPPFGEFDTVGIVVSLGPAPHGMKNFEVVNLAYPDSESSVSTYLSILFWEGIGAHGFSDIICIGATVACTNVQWRRGAHRTIPMAYSTEYSTFTQNPRQIYLRSAFDSVKKIIKDPMTYASLCATEIATEHQKKANILRSSAAQVTPSKASSTAVSLQDELAAAISPRTPHSVLNPGVTTPAKYSIQRRLEKLQWYAEPPSLSPVALNHSSTKVNHKFVPLIRTPENSECQNHRSDVINSKK